MLLSSETIEVLIGATGRISSSNNATKFDANKLKLVNTKIITKTAPKKRAKVLISCQKERFL
ncbi:MAG: hypothetical protein WCL18_01495, partial [bacterium]